MEMQQVRYFLAVCEELNFTRAAEKCHVAQPSLTRSIKLLENELGGPLFHRERNHTHLSELGNSVRPFLEEVWRRTQQAKDLAAGFATLKAAPLKLGIMCTIGPGNLVELLSSLQSVYPEIELQITDASAPMLQDMLLAGKLEAAIFCLPGEPDERLHYMPLFREQFMVAVGKQHRLAKNNAVRVRDLDGERYLNRVNCEYASHAGHIFSQQGARVRLVYRSERDDWILAMASAGLGFGFMPQYCAAEQPGVVLRPLVEPEIWREVNLVTVRGRPHSPAIGALVREAMRTQWAGGEALAVQKMRAEERPDY